MFGFINGMVLRGFVLWYLWSPLLSDELNT